MNRTRCTSSREIRQLCPLSVRVTAVFVDEDSGALSRWPMVALALCDLVQLDQAGREAGEREHGHVVFLGADGSGCLFPDEAANFVAFEFDGQEEDWTEQIAEYKRNRMLRGKAKPVEAGCGP